MDTNTLLNLVRMFGGAQQPMSPIPAPQAPMSPAPPGIAPVRPAGVPGIRPFSPAPSSFNLPRPVAPPPSRFAPPDADLTPPAPAAPAPQPVVGGLKKMMGADSASSGLGGIGSFFGNAMAGMGEGRTSAPPAAAFAQGFSGAFEAGQKRAAAAAEAKRQAEKDKREEEEFGWKREDRPTEQASKKAEEDRKAAAEKRAAEEARAGLLDKAVDLQKKRLDLNPNIKDRDVKEKITDDVNNHLNTVFPKDRMPPATPDEIHDEADKERARLEKYYGVESAAPAPGAAASTSPTASVGKTGLPLYNSQEELKAAVAAGKIKKGDSFETPTGMTKLVP